MFEVPKKIKELSLEEFLKLKDSCYLIDTRMPDVFAEKFIKNSINIPPINGSFRGWISSVLNPNDPFILIVEDASIVKEIAAQLTFAGFHEVLGYIVFDKNLGVEMESFDLCSVHKLAKSDDVYIIDVRTQPEWDLGHIPTAHHIELSTLKNHLHQIPKDKKIATICGAGFRSSIAASLLQKNGFKNMASTEGGMKAWSRADLEIQTDQD